MILFFLIFSLPAWAHAGHHHGPHTSEAKMKEAAPALQKIYMEIGSSYRQSVQPIFEAKCAACHSAGSPEPWYVSLPWIGRIVKEDREEATEHLEMSRFPFAGHGTVAEDLEALGKVTKKGSMPTRLYRFFHPSSVLNESDKKAVLAWVEASEAKLAKLEPKEKTK